MKMTARTFSRQLKKAMNAASSGKKVAVNDENSCRVFVFSLKKKGGWHFSNDAIGIVDAPGALSQRKGLGG
jgi:hypothetical protein